MAARDFDFHYDFSCPYAYLASVQLQRLEARTGARARYRPFLLGGVFRAHGVPQNLDSAQPAPKVAHIRDDLRRWARLYDVPLVHPEGHPQRTVEALRTVLAAPEEAWPQLTDGFFAAYWQKGQEIASTEARRRVLVQAGLDAAPILARAETDAVKDALRRRTDAAIERGIFGAPAFVVGDQLFWGADRMDQVERALGGEPACPYPEVDPRRLAPIDLYFDFSSPFAYLGVQRAKRWLGDAPTLRPMVLGAVFKSIGGPMVPMFEFSEAKRRYYALDLARQASELRVPFSFPTRFPVNSVHALRVAVAARLHPALVGRIFTAFWAEDRDISAPPVLAALASEVGLDGPALVEQAKTPAVKQALFAATERAQAAGVFGAPTFVVHRPDGERSLYWGGDRMFLAAQAAAGHTAVQ